MFLFPACLRVVRLKAIDHHFLIQKVDHENQMFPAL